MKITSYGAAREVTGSKHLIETNGKKILLDCGLFQGRRQESFEKNKNLPFDSSKIDAVILSHAHIDHCGNIPTLIKNGFQGKIFCTPATADITKIMLMDSAYIQEKDAEFFSRKLKKTALPIKPLYGEKEARESLFHFTSVGLHIDFEVVEGVRCKFFNAGHVLGSEIIQLSITEDGETKKLVFTGDLGRPKRSILSDPEFIKKADILICESTYGGRNHGDTSKNREKLAKVVNDTAKRGGKLIIPSFALERTQEVIFDLNYLKRRNKIPQLKIFLDSPLATKVTEIFSKHIECFDEESKKEFLREEESPFDNVVFTKTVNESKSINLRKGPCIVISASGMCEAGRIRHHLRNNISDPKNTILIVGYQAEHTLGRRIVEKRKMVKIFDQMYSVKAKIEVINGFSGHAGQNELVDFACHIENLKKIILVHGEISQIMILKDLIEKRKKGLDIYIPEAGEVIEA